MCNLHYCMPTLHLNWHTKLRCKGDPSSTWNSESLVCLIIPNGSFGPHIALLSLRVHGNLSPEKTHPQWGRSRFQYGHGYLSLSTMLWILEGFRCNCKCVVKIPSVLDLFSFVSEYFCKLCPIPGRVPRPHPCHLRYILWSTPCIRDSRSYVL